VAGAVSHGASLDSTIQFLLRSAAADFHAHRPPDPVRFRDVRLGHTTNSSGERQYRLCGQFLPAAEGTAEWTPFTTIKTSGYEQWLGAQAAGYCRGASFAWDSVDDLSSSLWSRFESLQGESQQSRSLPSEPGQMRVVLLGTQAGPTFNPQRLGISTLVLAGSERLLFDAGRGTTTGMARVGINPADVTKIFVTHLHSDHVISLPELLISPWASQGRIVPLSVWGPRGTRAMMKKFEEALAFDIHVRRDVDEKFPAEGVRVVTTDITEGVVYEVAGVKVTAFLVDHGPVKPAYGYRVDFRGRSLVLSGDTRSSDNLVRFATGVDVLIHEIGRYKQDPLLSGPPDEFLPNSRQTRRTARTIAEHHTDGAEVGAVLDRAKPKLAVFSHYNVDPQSTLALIRQRYAGPVEFGEDSMTIEIGPTVEVRRRAAPQ
jgi:ribonuclease Z